MPKWAVYENKRIGNRFCTAVFFPDDAGHPDLPSYIPASRLPVEVNDVGGYHEFDPEVEEGWRGCRFVEFREYDEDEDEPVSFAERVPKNHSGFTCGWIAPNGDTYSCAQELHMKSARLIADDLYPGDRPGGEQCLEDHGWVRLAERNGWTSEYDDGVFFTKAPSKRQIGRLLDLGRYTSVVEENVEMARMRRSSGAGIFKGE